MREEPVGDRGRVSVAATETRACDRVVDHPRFPAEVRAGADDRAPDADERELVQRAQRQHETELTEVGRDRLNHGRRRAVSAWQEHDGRGSALEQRARCVVELRVFGDDLEVPGHEREGAARATFAPAQLGDGLRVGRVAAEVVAARALDRDDLTVQQEAPDRVHLVHHGVAVGGEGASVGALELCAGPAGKARARRSVLSAARRIGAFGATGGAEREVAK